MGQDVGYPTPNNETGRIASLRLLNLLGADDDGWWEPVTRLAATLCGTPKAVINFIETTRQYSLAAQGYEAADVAREDSMCATSIMSPEPSFTGDATLDPRWSSNPFVTGIIDTVRTYVAAPLTLPTGHTVGTICAFSNQVSAPSEAQIRGMADLAALTVQMLELRDRGLALSLAATRDPLTELPNRALMRESLDQALARNARGEANVAVIFVDLNGFKPINDTYGHGTGDELLRAVAGRLLRCVRSSDLVSRPGGDEFVIVCSSPPDHPEDAAPWRVDRVMERITAAFAEPYELTAGPVRVGASLGLAYAESTETAEGLLHRADQAMYAQKGSRAR